MAISFDAYKTQNISHAAATISFTPVGTPRGILVLCVDNYGPTTPADRVTGVTYGGVSMTEVALSPLNGNSGSEMTMIHGFFLGSSIPIGTQDCVFTLSGSSDGIVRCIGMYSITAAADTEVVDTSTISSTSLLNPSDTLSLGGATAWCALAGQSGRGTDADTTPLANWTSRTEYDFGSQIGLHYSYNTVGSTDVTYGYTCVADDAFVLGVAIKESVTAALSLILFRKTTRFAHLIVR